MTDFRFADVNDVPVLTALINRAFAVEKFFKVGERTDEAELASLLEAGRMLVAEEDGSVIGCVYVKIEGERGYIGLLSVDPTRQRTGLGTRLISAAEEFCRESGCHFADITVVNLREELPGIYQKLGYVVTGTEPFPSEQRPVKMDCHFLCMSKELGHR
ncbi:MAG: GNAT family N-acetyltransferase [Acidobacteria bacterium]|nr:GNAT family N-acetyltransferase [Acidobacteriota bacterium]MBW4044815.1 GNAT family N-acetyltransferase [Acidobacteriota bacterium]